MMLCLALRCDPERVYLRARRQFTVAEISDAFAAARGLALPSQLRRKLREQGRDVHAEFLALLPARPHPIRVQHWSARRLALLAAMIPAALVVAFSFKTVLVNSDATTTPLPTNSLRCDQLEPLLLEAQSVPSATLLPCVRPLPPGWTLGAANVRNGWTRFTLDHDEVGKPAVVVRLSATCETSGASPAAATVAGTTRFERTEPQPVGPGHHVLHPVPRRLRQRRAQRDQRPIDHRRGRRRHRLHHPRRPATNARPTLRRSTPPRPDRTRMTIGHLTDALDADRRHPRCSWTSR